ncbi:MAG: hypothetical protein LBE50_04875 [Gallionellaceae bacterium]|nr:hypothetical protein [Gallionellaceae bacterium]
MAQAQTVPDGANLSALGAPASTTVWDLQGNATVGSLITLPTGAPGLTINGASGSSIVTLTGGRFNNGATAATLVLGGGDITFTGGVNNSGNGGVISSTANFTLNGDNAGALTFTGNIAGGAGAIFSNTGTIAITGDYDAISFNNNHANGGGTVGGGAM